MITPPDRSLYRLDPELDAAFQRLRLEAVGEAGLQNVSLWVDGQELARFSEPPYQTWWLLQSGEHQVWAQAVRASGESITSQAVNFTVAP